MAVVLSELSAHAETLRRHGLVWALFFFANGMMPLVNTIEGAFARSLIWCETGQVEETLFSGSAHCGDRLQVITDGQVLSSWASSVESTTKIVTVLAAVVCIDLYGHRQILVAGLSSIALSVAFFELACWIPAAAKTLFVLGQGLQGAFPVELLFAQVVADLAHDMSVAESQRMFEMKTVVMFLPVYFFGFVASFIQVLELRDYTLLWGLVLAINLKLLALTYFHFPETQQPREKEKEASAGGEEDKGKAVSTNRVRHLVKGVRKEILDYRALFTSLRETCRVDMALLHMVLTTVASSRFAVLIFSYSMSYYDLSAATVILYAIPIIVVHVACAPLVAMVCRSLGSRQGFIAVCGFKFLTNMIFVLQPYYCWSWFLQYYMSSLVSGWDALMDNVGRKLFKDRFSKYLALVALGKDAAKAVAAPLYALTFDGKSESYARRALPGFVSFVFFGASLVVVFAQQFGVWRAFSEVLDELDREGEERKETEREKKED